MKNYKQLQRHFDSGYVHSLYDAWKKEYITTKIFWKVLYKRSSISYNDIIHILDIDIEIPSSDVKELTKNQSLPY